MPWLSHDACSPLQGVDQGSPARHCVTPSTVLSQNMRFLVLLTECPSRWEEGSMSRRRGMRPTARAASQLALSLTLSCGRTRSFPAWANHSAPRVWL